ncbi:MAG: M48 family metalloprotease [Rectinemataceae bacterium]|nr:M48 family metalloprotease [Rectinemataceae bacterium]
MKPRTDPSLQSLLLAAVAVICLSLLGSCLTLSDSMELLSSQAVSEGLLDRYQATMLKLAAQAAVDASRELSPEEEYYVGRAVAASIFSSYPPYDSPGLNNYLNKLGQGLSLYSSRPAIYEGYRFIVLDSEEVNAFASPGGHVLVTRGLLRLATSEDELAAFLAHEVAHIALGHGLASVQGARITQIASTYAIDAGNASGGDVGAFTAVFGDSISELAKILVISGYSQAYESQADLEARRIIAAAGYDPNALARLVNHLPSGSRDNASGFAVTHPQPQSRLEALAAQPFIAPKAAAVKRMWPSPRGDDAKEEAMEKDPTLVFFARAKRFAAMKALF